MRAAAASFGAALRRIGARAANGVPHIRPIRRADAHAVQAFVRALSDRSRLLRYFRPLRELPEGMLRQLTETDGRCDAVFVALARDAEGTRVVGLAQYARMDEAGCEFALAVADEWQGRGLGRRLLRTLLGAARRGGFTRMVGDVMRDNRAMLGLARAFGFTVGHSPLDASAVRSAHTLDDAERRTPRRLTLAGASF